jgi:hypothetical protein
MDRRDTLKLLIGGASALTVVPVLGGCGSKVQDGVVPWNGPVANISDVRLRILAYASLAPNAHNTQAWLLDLRHADTIDLYVDSTRVLPETDPLYRQVHISQGTFLEVLDLAARELGYAANISLFPHGEYGQDRLEDQPTATVRLTKSESISRDPLFGQVLSRQTNRRLYEEGRALSSSQKTALTACAPTEQARISIVDEAALRSRLTDICGEAMAVEVTSRARNLETARWWHFSRSEANFRRDGFGLAQAGESGFGRWFVESFILKRSSAGEPTGPFAAGAVDRARAQARSASAFAIFTSESNTRQQQLLVGRAYTRFALAASALGLAVHPMTQVTEEYPEMDALRTRLHREVGTSVGSRVQMLVRLGFADPVPHAPRRAVLELLRSTATTRIQPALYQTGLT